MKSLRESLFDNDIISSSPIKYHPKTRDELIDCIKKEINEQGSDANLNCIDVSKITDMNHVFSAFHSAYNKTFSGPGAWDLFGNIDISLWDVRNVTDMSNMFDGSKKFNCDLSKWNVRNVTDMSNMFRECKSFNCNLSKWNVKNVKNMAGMFSGCDLFDCDLSKWDVRNVENMNEMFYECKKFNCDLSKWNLKSIMKMDWMGWGTNSMFVGCTSLKKIPSWYHEES